MNDKNDTQMLAGDAGSPPASAAQAAATIPVSVIMPVRNEERHLAEAVAGVLAQDYAGGLELVLAVGPSKDRTAEIAKRLAGADSRITVVENPSGQIPSALNAAVRTAKHAIIVRVDGHALLPPGYVSQAVLTLTETGAANVGGIMAAEGISPFQRAVAWAMTSPAGVGSAKYHTGGGAGPAESVYLGAFRRDAIEGAGGYDEHYLRAEDWELNHRIRAGGDLIWFTPAMRVSYRPRATVSALAAQYFHYGRWRHVVARMHAGTINLRYLAPPFAVLAMLTGTLIGLAGVGCVAAGETSWWAWLLVSGFAAPLCYLFGVLVVTVLAARSLTGRALAWLPVVLATMHTCWGIGFLTSPRHLARTP
jgi:hypothetical protein